MKNIDRWTFPEYISFETVPEFMEKFNGLYSNNQLIFDMSNTKDLHSSFIGFLLHTKNRINKNGGNLVIIVSQNVDKILDMLNLKNHFSSEIILSLNRKSA